MVRCLNFYLLVFWWNDHEFLELSEGLARRPVGGKLIFRLRIDFDFYRISRNESQAILAALEIIRFIFQNYQYYLHST